MESYNSDGRILSVYDDKTQSQFLSDYLPKDKKKRKNKSFDTHKAFGDQVATTLKESDKLSHQKQGKRISECAQNLEFGWVLLSTATGLVKLLLKSAWFCRVRHCPICQWRRSLMWISRFFDAIPRIYEAYPDMRYIMLTLTVRNCSISELRAIVNQMNKAFERLTKRKIFPALGFVRCLEVTRGNDDSAHPHFHILLAVPPSYFSGGSRGSYLSKDAWSVLWQEAMRLDYKPVVDVRIVKPRTEKLVEGIPDALPDPVKSLMSAITEVVKYTTKPSDMVKDKAWLLEMVDQMRNVRAVALGGIFKQFLKESEDNEDLVTASESENEKAVTNEGGLHFGWFEKIKRYVKKDKS